MCPTHKIGMDREIWFEKVLWSYMPCHWKGLAVMVGIIFPTFVLIFVSQSLLRRLGHDGLADLSFFVFFFPAWVSLLVIAKRHS